MLLADYSSHNHCFEFDPDTGICSHIKLSASRKDCIGYSGMAQLLRSLREGKVLVAQYVSSGDAWLSIGSEKWKLFDESIAVKHNEMWGVFLCELSLHKDGKCIKKLRYLRRDWFLAIIDSTYDQLAFSLANLPVDLVPHELSSLQKQREDFIKHWSRNSAPNRALDNLQNRTHVIAELREDEQVVKEGTANLQKGIETVGGKLYLTNRRLLFVAHKFNVQGGVSELDLSDIQSSHKCWTKFLGFIPIFPNSLAVYTKHGEEYRFVLYRRSEWAVAIETQRKA